MSTSALDNMLAGLRHARRTYMNPAGHSSVGKRKVHGIHVGWEWRIWDGEGHVVDHGWNLRRADADRSAVRVMARRRATLDEATLAAERAWLERWNGRRGYATCHGEGCTRAEPMGTEWPCREGKHFYRHALTPLESEN